MIINHVLFDFLPLVALFVIVGCFGLLVETVVGPRARRRERAGIPTIIFAMLGFVAVLFALAAIAGLGG